MKTLLSWHNLVHNRGRTLVAVAGVAFAVLLILLQLGFHGSVVRTATTVYDRLDFDLLLLSPEYIHLSKAGTFPRLRLQQALAVEGVQAASPFYLGFTLWRNPETLQRRSILLMGFGLEDRVFRHSEINAARNALSQPETVLFDRLSRPEFGPRSVGLRAEAGASTVRVAGLFSLGTGFGASGAIAASDHTFFRLAPMQSRDAVSIGLLHAAPGADVRDVARRLQAALPADVRVLTREMIVDQERSHWLTKTSVGIIFAMGVGVAVLVGMAIVYHVLASDIASHVKEYATLKAIGYHRRYLAQTVVSQAWIVALLGYIPGFVLALGLYKMTRDIAHMPIEMTALRACSVLVLSLVMCSVAGVAALRKVASTDPADLF